METKKVEKSKHKKPVDFKSLAKFKEEKEKALDNNSIVLKTKKSAL